MVSPHDKARKKPPDETAEEKAAADSGSNSSLKPLWKVRVMAAGFPG